MPLKLEQVTKTYRRGQQELHALKAVSLEVRRGEFLVIMGPSGSGKSTCLHLLGALDRPTSGQVLFEGNPLQTMSDEQLAAWRRQKIGLVFQFFHLLPTMSAEENVALPLLLDGRPKKEALAKATPLLEAVGLGNRASHRPTELSGGQMQRVAIARALINSPAVLLADEPTGNLDSASGQEIMKLLKSFQEQFSQTVVMVTHDPRATEYADRVVRVRDGEVESIAEGARSHA